MQPEDLIKGSIRLISLPEVFIKINEMVEDPASSATDVGNFISQDPALTARLLKIANSPLYGFPSRIDTISRSITIIGMRGIRDLVLASSTIDIFSKLSSDFIDMNNYWQHSMYCAVYARLLALKCNALHVEPFFISGLLHDIGQLIILHKLPEMARESHLRAKDHGLPLSQVEREVIGFDHMQVGVELLRFWHLPTTILDAVGFHQRPSEAQDSPLGAAIVHIANHFATRVYPLVPNDNTKDQNNEIDIDPAALEIACLSVDFDEEIREEANIQFSSMQSMFLTKAA